MKHSPFGLHGDTIWAVNPKHCTGQSQQARDDRAYPFIGPRRRAIATRIYNPLLIVRSMPNGWVVEEKQTSRRSYTMYTNTWDGGPVFQGIVCSGFKLQRNGTNAVKQGRPCTCSPYMDNIQFVQGDEIQHLESSIYKAILKYANT